MSREGYDVLRLIEHNKVCYVSSEYVKGSPLLRWLKYHPQIAKETLFVWMHNMVRLLEQFHKCRGHPCYQYVNPYSIIVTEEGTLYFLDLGAASNEEELKRMQRRTVREYFLPASEAYYQKASIALDIYGLGRTFQYLLSESEPEPQLNSREIIKLQKIISKCLNEHSGKSFQKVSEIHKFIPQYKPIKEKKSGMRKLFIPVIAAAVIFAGISGRPEVTGNEKKTIGQKSLESNVNHKGLSDEDQYKLELGVLYFLEVKDYEKSRQCFQSVDHYKFADDMAVVSEYLSGGHISEEKLRDALEDARKQLTGEEEGAYYRCLIRGYACLESEEDMRALSELGEKYLKLGIPDELPEIAGCMAMAYEKNGETKSAIEMYELQLQEEETEAARIEIYKKLPALLCGEHRSEQAQEILRRGIEEFPVSAELRILLIKVQCQDANVDRGVCMKTIEESVRAVPELAEKEEFQKLMKECGFETEGENVWIKQ
ncbi:hypothetical protein AALA13_05110 [Lachnospiraceae bacterium 50-23]|jgi:tetratricopeptide (TPR) repeat protein|nr:serine/threonine protein kinase [Dorea sp.]